MSSVKMSVKTIDGSDLWEGLYLCGSGDCVRGFHFCSPPPCQEKTKTKTWSVSRELPEVHSRLLMRGFPPSRTSPWHACCKHQHTPVQPVPKPHTCSALRVCIFTPKSHYGGMKTSAVKPEMRVWLLFVYPKQSPRQKRSSDLLYSALNSHKTSFLQALRLLIWNFRSFRAVCTNSSPLQGQLGLSGWTLTATMTTLSESQQ